MLTQLKSKRSDICILLQTVSFENDGNTDDDVVSLPRGKKQWMAIKLPEGINYIGVTGYKENTKYFFLTCRQRCPSLLTKINNTN